MWKQGKDIGITPIKLENKPTTKELDDCIFQTNDLLYFWSGRYISPAARETILSEIVEIGSSIPKSLPQDKAKRQMETLSKLRQIYRTVQKYSPDRYEDNAEAIQKMLNYQVSNFIRNKQNLTDEDKLKLLVENKTLWDKIIPSVPFADAYNIKTASYATMQKEILESLNKKFAI